MTAWDYLLDFIWVILASFLLVALLICLFWIISDLFSDHKMRGWAKALWVVFLIFLPFIGALVYLIARGGGMAQRRAAQANAAKVAQDEYIKQVAGQVPDVASQIAAAKQLLDSGSITQAEYEQIKAQVLSGTPVPPAVGAPAAPAAAAGTAPAGSVNGSKLSK